MMSLNELMDAAHGVSNMYLAHEIAVDKDFMLEKLKPEESEMEIQVKKIVHQVCQNTMGIKMSLVSLVCHTVVTEVLDSKMYSE